MKPVSLESVRRINPVPDADAVVNQEVRARALQGVLDAPRVQLSRGTRARLPRARVLVSVLLASLVLAAAALAASGVLSGAPYRAPSWIPLNRNPSVSVGVPVSGSARLLALRAPDPAGGPPWGLRVLRTTRGLGCVQVGRVVNGQLGVLGQDGVAGDDHRFHPLAVSLLQPWDCFALDAHNRGFVGIVATAYASGPVLERSCARSSSQRSTQRPCRAADRRTLAYGLLGPSARSLSYLSAGRRTTVAAGGRQGSYLVVLPTARAGDEGVSVGPPGFFPGALAVTYWDGLSCRPELLSPACAREGYAPPSTPLARIGSVHVRTAIRRYHRGAKSYADLMVRFRAPVAIANAGVSYWLTVTTPPPCSTIDGQNLERDVARGAPVTLRIQLPGNCPGVAIAHVLLTREAGPSGDSLPGRGAASLATFTFKLPRTNGAREGHSR